MTGSSLLSVMDRLAFEVAPDTINKAVSNLGNTDCITVNISSGGNIFDWSGGG